MKANVQRIWGIIPGFRNREKALEYFETIVHTAPYSDYAPLSLMNASRGYKKIGESEAAIDALDRMINTYPRNVLTPDAYLKIAQTHSSLVDGPSYDQASTKQAITYYEDYMILFPGDAGMVSAEKGLANMKKVLAESKITMADYYLKYRHNYKAAKVFYNEAITVYPDSDIAAQARTKLAVVDAKLEQQAALPPPKPKPVKPQKKKKLWMFLGRDFPAPVPSMPANEFSMLIDRFLSPRYWLIAIRSVLLGCAACGSFTGHGHVLF